VHQLPLELLQLGLRFRRLRLESAAAPFDQVSRAGEVESSRLGPDWCRPVNWNPRSPSASPLTAGGYRSGLDPEDLTMAQTVIALRHFL
jgi:hypothetical protein